MQRLRSLLEAEMATNVDEHRRFEPFANHACHMIDIMIIGYQHADRLSPAALTHHFIFSITALLDSC